MGRAPLGPSQKERAEYSPGELKQPNKLTALGETAKLRLHDCEDVTNNPASEVVMSEQAQAIFDEAMKLPIGERESLVSRLMRANDEEPLTDAELAAHEEAWAPEIRRRIAELESGRVQTVPWSEVRAELRAMIGD